MIDITAVYANYVGAFPNIVGKNATGAGATDGTEWIAATIDNWLWGPAQRLLSMASITPNGVTESASASQLVDAMQLIFGPPGTICEWNLNADPATFGARFLLLNGQGVLRASYPDLDTNTWVGAGLNATASAWFRADDSAGTSRNSAGVYLILPESRGYTVRGLDVAASVDPEGASRDVGHLQSDAMQRITGDLFFQQTDGEGTGAFSGGAASASLRPANGTGSCQRVDFDSDDSTSPNAAKTDDVETRMANRATQFAVRY